MTKRVMSVEREREIGELAKSIINIPDHEKRMRDYHRALRELSADDKVVFTKAMAIQLKGIEEKAKRIEETMRNAPSTPTNNPTTPKLKIGR